MPGPTSSCGRDEGPAGYGPTRPFGQDFVTYGRKSLTHRNDARVTHPALTSTSLLGRPTGLVEDHLPLVSHTVREIASRLPAHVDRDELLSAGLAALAQAARAFEPERGVSFPRFASARVRGAIVDELRGADWASRSVRRRARQVESAREELTAALGHTPTADEIAGRLSVDPSEVRSVASDVQRAVVLSLQGFGEGSTLDEVVALGTAGPEEVLVHRERVAYLHDAVAVLPERLKRVVCRYFFEERPMAEIALELGVSESRVSQMRSEALAMLKGALQSALDPSLLDRPARPEGCVARRRETYFAAVATHRDYRARVSAVVSTEALAATA